jgi:hypothetical protein
MAFNIGETAGDYQIIGILGAGGMGKVYKVRNVISDRVEAIKVLLPDLEKETELADRFMREIKLLASLTHPNIAGLHTALRLQNQLLMVMEFVEGRSLEDRLKESPVPAAEAVGYVIQALAALGYAHERGVIHRDIKPANMMVTPSGELKLMDFGIAKAVADRRLTMTGTTLGSLYYMSPEQVKGSGNLDGRSDLYSMGVTLYELVTGTRPFKGDSDYSIMVAHLEQLPVAPIQIDPTLPPALNEIILTAIQKDPNLRFQTAQAFRAALENVARTLPGPGVRQAAAAPVPPPRMPEAPPARPMPGPAAAVPFAPPPPPAPPPSGHRGLWMALGAIAALAVLAVAALQVPRFLKTRAGGQTAAPPAVETAAPPPQQQPATTPATPPPVEQAAPPASTVPAAQQAPAPPRRVSPPPRAASNEAPAAAGQAAPPPPQAQQAAPPPADSAALDELKDRFGVIGSRANTLREGLQELVRQQRAMGVGLRGDMTLSWKRMELALDEAEASLKAGNTGRARRSLDTAEGEADKLDKFLGH